MTPKGLLVRVGVDQTFGRWNAPVHPDTGDFVFVPIPEALDEMRPGHERRYAEVVQPLADFSARNGVDVALPAPLLDQGCHFDPDFAAMTYGDQGHGRGWQVAKLNPGDFIAFFAGLRPVAPCEHRLLYALIGFMVVARVVRVGDATEAERLQNAHGIRTNPVPTDLIVFADPARSGRLRHAIAIGERRRGAYRVRRDLLQTWGGLGVADGFIQRSVNPPWLTDPERFLHWFRAQHPVLLRQN